MLLGDIAIEGGDFTMAFFMECTISDLLDSLAGGEKEEQEEVRNNTTRKSMGDFKTALATVEDTTDFHATRDQPGELSLTDLLVFNPDVINMNNEVNKEYRKVLDSIADSIIGNFIKINCSEFLVFFKNFYPEHYEHEQCKTAHGRMEKRVKK